MSEAKRPTLEERAKAWMREHWFDDEPSESQATAGLMDALRAAYLDGKRDGVEAAAGVVDKWPIGAFRFDTCRIAREGLAAACRALLDGGDDDK